MAQGELFSKFIKSTGGLANSTNELKNAINDLYEGQLNVYRVKRDLLRSDTESLNVLKRTKSVGNKIYQQMKDNAKVQKNLNDSKKQLNRLETEILKSQKSKNKLLTESLVKQRNQLRLEYELNKVRAEQMHRSLPLMGKLAKTSAGISKAVTTAVPVIGALSSGIGGLIDIISKPLRKAFNVFLEMESVVGNLSADIGLTKKETLGLANNFTKLTLSSMEFGGTMQDVASVMSQFSEITNKNRAFNEREIGQLVELGLATKLGVDGAAELAASFDNIGISLEKTIELTDDARKLSAKTNVNTTKVLRTYKSLVESLTGIGFGNSLKNLTRLAVKAEAIRFDIAKSTESFKDAFFDPERAVEAAAKMQVLGGRFAQSFGDPMQLAFESMNNPEKLAEKVTDLVKGAVIKSGNEFIIPPAERKMLQLAAETLGQDYDELKKTAIEQAKISDKMASLAKSGVNLMGFDEDDRLALATLMQLNKDGKYEIKMSDGTTELLKNITDKNQLKQILKERKANEQAAIGRKNLMERLSLIYDRFMVSFSNVFNKIFKQQDFDSLLVKVESAGTALAKFINEEINNSGGLVEAFNGLVKIATNVFKKVEDVFTGKGSFVSKVTESLKILAKDLVVEIIKYVIPIFKAGMGALLMSMKNVPIVGNSIYQSGLRMTQSAITQSDTVEKMYGDDAEKILKTQSDQSRSATQGSMLALKSLYQGKQTIKYAKNGLLTGRNFGMPLVKATKSGSKMVGNIAYNKAGNLAGKNTAKMIAKNATTILGKESAELAFKRLPVLGSLLSFYSAYEDLKEGDYTGVGLNALSGLANIANLVAPGFGSGASMALDGINAARELGVFDDGVIYKDGTYAKFNKGDMVQFIDQAAMERANVSGGSNTNIVQHSGVITIKSDDGKVVTWEQMYGARDLIGGRMASINKSYESGFGNYQNPYTAPIKPLI